MHLVSAADADVIFESSDDVRFHIHRKNLEIQSSSRIWYQGRVPLRVMEDNGSLVADYMNVPKFALAVVAVVPSCAVLCIPPLPAYRAP